MAAVAAFARANRSTASSSTASRPARHRHDRQGLSRRAQALADLGISDAEAEALGLRVYKVALTWPLEEEGAPLRRRAEGRAGRGGEKRGFIEDQLVRILYNMPADRRPSVVGKRDRAGTILLPSTGELDRRPWSRAPSCSA